MADLQQQQPQKNYNLVSSTIPNNTTCNRNGSRVYTNSSSFNPRSHQHQINVTEFVDTSTTTTAVSSYNVDRTATTTGGGEGTVRRRRAQVGARSYRVVAKPPPKPPQRPYFDGWALLERDLNQKKRMARYKAYAVEGQLKASIRWSLSWLKSKYSG